MGLFLSVYAEKRPAEKEITCTIEPEKKQFTLGEHPKFNFKVKNNSNRKILLVKILDGSDAKFREPLGYFEVTGPNAKNIPDKRKRCGNTNPLQVSDFIWVQPGEEVKLAQNGLSLWNGQFNKTGRYKIKFHYSTLNDDFSKWVGGPLSPEGLKDTKKACADLFKNRKKINMTSEIEIQVIDKK